MVERLSTLVDRIIENHIEIITYYELANLDNSLDVKGLSTAYGMHERYHTSRQTAIHATYLSIKRLAKKPETIKRLEEEYNLYISRKPK